MTLGFSTIINKNKTYFVEKICKGIKGFSPLTAQLAMIAGYEFNTQVYLDCSPKIHTAREDKQGRWAIGKKVQAVVNNRTSRRFQFAPDMPCKNTQVLEIKYWYNPTTQRFDAPCIYIDNKELTKKQVDQFALNDGFNNRAELFQYFNKDWKGVLIHWTDFKY